MSGSDLEETAWELHFMEGNANQFYKCKEIHFLSRSIDYSWLFPPIIATEVSRKNTQSKSTTASCGVWRHRLDLIYWILLFTELGTIKNSRSAAEQAIHFGTQ